MQVIHDRTTIPERRRVDRPSPPGRRAQAADHEETPSCAAQHGCPSRARVPKKAQTSHTLEDHHMSIYRYPSNSWRVYSSIPVNRRIYCIQLHRHYLHGLILCGRCLIGYKGRRCARARLLAQPHSACNRTARVGQHNFRARERHRSGSLCCGRKPFLCGRKGLR